MSETQKTINAEAAGWVARMQSPDSTDAEMHGLTEWLETSEAHAEAFASALVLWSELRAPEQSVPESASITRLPVRKIPRVALGAGLMGMAAVLVAGFLFLPDVMTQAQHYETKVGGRQTLTLSDGSDLSLNTNTKVSVTFSGKHRTLMLEHGEIALNVGDKSQAPLTVVVGDVSIRDIGTQFNVSRLDGVVRVTVREGIVDMTPEHGTAQRVVAGQEGRFSEARHLNSVRRIDPEPAFAWQSSRAIYQGTPLSEVVRDLNRYYDKPIVVDDGAGDLRLSAILALDSQAAVARRLADFLPIDVHTTDKAIHISPRGRTAGRL